MCRAGSTPCVRQGVVNCKRDRTLGLPKQKAVRPPHLPTAQPPDHPDRPDRPTGNPTTHPTARLTDRQPNHPAAKSIARPPSLRGRRPNTAERLGQYPKNTGKLLQDPPCELPPATCARSEVALEVAHKGAVIRPKFGRRSSTNAWPIIARFGPTLAEVRTPLPDLGELFSKAGPGLTSCGRIRPDSGRVLATGYQLWASSVQLGPTSANIGERRETKTEQRKQMGCHHRPLPSRSHYNAKPLAQHWWAQARISWTRVQSVPTRSPIWSN